jgi:ribosomal protein S18 acetylase RimI-like enzyme
MRDFAAMPANKTFVVRPARPDDLLAVLQVMAEGGPDRTPPDAATAAETATWARMMATADLTVYVAEVDTTVIGTVTLLTMPNLGYDCAPSAFVEAVVVAAAHRRVGIGTALMRRVLADAQMAGCNKVQLLSHKRHATDGAHRLYTSLGFDPEAEGFRRYLGPVPDAVLAARNR